MFADPDENLFYLTQTKDWSSTSISKIAIVSCEAERESILSRKFDAFQKMKMGTRELKTD